MPYMAVCPFVLVFLEPAFAFTDAFCSFFCVNHGRYSYPAGRLDNSSINLRGGGYRILRENGDYKGGIVIITGRIRRFNIKNRGINRICTPLSHCIAIRD